MPTLQDLVRAQGPESAVPAPTVPAPGGATMGEAYLPEANLEAPASATQALEQLARQRYGDPFVDQYGDTMGFRRTTFDDRLRNIGQIMSTMDPQAADRLVAQGAQARADLEQSMVEEAARKRKELFEVYAFIPKGLKAKMSPRTVLQLFSEQFRSVTGQDPHPGIIQGLIDMEQKGETPIMEVLAGIADSSLSAADAEAMGVDVKIGLDFLSGYESRKLRKQEIDQRAGQLGDREVRLKQRQREIKARERNAKLARRDRIFLSLRNAYDPTPKAGALTTANRMTGLPPPTAEDIAMFGEQDTTATPGGIGGGAPIGIPQTGGARAPSGGPIVVR